MNSASAILTNNADRYFITFKPEGSRSMHFKLTFEPSCFDSSFREYKLWQDNLIKYDWPCYFAQHSSKKKSIMSIENLVVDSYETEFDEFIAKRRKVDILPTSWKDLIYISKSNNNVFAKRYLPKNTPLGFYFGVPMTRDEFDALKYNSSQYAYMYGQSTVIDPTDKYGELYHHEDICPFYHVKGTAIPEKANIIFYEGDQKNQIVCWTKQDILPDQELLLLNHHNTPSNNSAFMDYWPKSPIYTIFPPSPQQQEKKKVW